MSQKSKFLVKHGWHLLSTKKVGMMIIQRWSNNKGSIMSQQDAYNFQRRVNAVKQLDVAAMEAV